MGIANEPVAYIVSKVHAMEIREGVHWFDVEWEGYLGDDGKPERTWEAQAGCMGARLL